MDLVTIVDEQNNKYTYKRYKGYAFNQEVVGNVRDRLEEVANFNVREDDVLIDIFPKSGTHWLYNTVLMLRSGSLKYNGTPAGLEFNDLKMMEDMSSPRTLASHLRFRFLPEQMKLGKGKIVTLTRNPKDLVVSMYHMMQKMGDLGYQGTFEGFLKRFLSEECFCGNGSWFSWIKDMEEWDTPNFLCLSYHDLKENTFANVVKLAKFLEVDHDEEFLRSVSENIQFDKLKESHKNATPPTDRWKHVSEDGRLPIYRKGKVGDWKNMFTVAQNENFDKIFKEKVEELGLNIDTKFE
ncbi:sulfotransferase 4A1-like [Argopecten irradians]|uniref:sulfotransferase 4A1-like n=1 Tax=Argopecten irradians TaxID=31199 RepID=UPI00371E3AB0